MINSIRDLERWLCMINFPNHEKLRVTIEVESINGVARLIGAISEEMEALTANGPGLPMTLKNGTSKFVLNGIPVEITYARRQPTA